MEWSLAAPKRWSPNLRFAALLSLVHFSLLVYFSQSHELWRDEVRALNIVLDSNSPLDLLGKLHNEGHPILWYAVLYLGYGVLHTKAVLVLASLLIAEGAVFVLAAYAPFPRWQRVLFALGLFPLYEFSIMCRNYGLAMLLGFVYAALYERRFVRPVWFGLVIALFANTTAFCAVIAAWMTLLWSLERIYVEVRRKDLVLALRSRMALGVSTALLGIAFSIYVFRADATALFYRPQNISVDAALAAFYEHLTHPASRLSDLFSLSGTLPLTIAVWLVTLYLLIRNPFIAGLFYGSIAAFDLFSALIYGPATRHKGLAYVIIIAALWLDAQLPVRELPRSLGALCRALAPVIAGAIPIMFAIQANAGYEAIKLDRVVRLSGDKWFAHVIEAHPEYADAIVIGEPDLRVEALSYYVDNPIYQARDRKFGRQVNFSHGSATDLTLDGILAMAEQLRASEHKPVLIAMGPTLLPEGPFFFVHTFVKVFRYDPDMLKRFRAATRRVATIRGNIAQIVEPEEFDVYALPLR
ncbi:MAG: rane protein [Myxococcaceae bacterium]|nr:rane protein [Myxococcaceae bacterium]